jgi:replicative DNA helicase
VNVENTDRLEAQVLGAILRDGSVFDDVALILTAEDFRTHANRTIWIAMGEFAQEGKPIEPVGLTEALIQGGKIVDLGGYGCLVKLQDEAPTAIHAVHHARMVRKHAILRRLADAGRATAFDAENPADDAEAVLEQAENKILSVGELGSEGQTYSAREVVAETLRSIDERTRKGKGLSGISSGFDDLDSLTAGWQQGELIVLAARPSVGKTALGLTFAAHAAIAERQAVFFASLEQRRTELIERLLSAHARIDGQRIRRGDLDKNDFALIDAAAQIVGAAPLFIDDASRQSMLRIGANARRIKRKHGLGLVVVDYLQLIEPENRRDPRHEQVGCISRRLKGLARELCVPVIAFAQLNRESVDRAGQRPRLSDLRESGSIEADADVVMLLHQTHQENEDLDVILAKQRNGPIGDVTLLFDRTSQRFESFSGNPFES